MRSKKAERLKLSDRARDKIRDRIISGAFPMGRKLREGELSEMLGMSKSPIREALLQLESEGLVEMPPDRPAHVFSMGADKISELGELRQILEKEALQLAIKRDDLGLATALDSVVLSMREALEAGDALNYRLLDRDFHTAIFDRCGNSYLRSTYMMLSFRIQALRNWLSRDSELNNISFADHVDIVEAIRQGDFARAQSILRKHIAETTENYLARFGPSVTGGADATGTCNVLIPEMERFCVAALTEVNANEPTISAVVRALSHASKLGIDSHGYRLLPHYLEGLNKGRLNPYPAPKLIGATGGARVLDADNAHGALAGFEAAKHAVDLAREHGLGAVAIRNSSHFGAAGAFAMAIAEQGMMGLAFCNSDSFVRLHGGAQRFHGTNPIAAAAPSEGPRPWLLDMATSSIPFNRVLLAQALGHPLAPEVASDTDGHFVTDPMQADMLAPLGGALFGYKGAGLAGLTEILTTAFSDAPLSVELPPMISTDMTTPRRLGAFVLALDPVAFGGADVFRAVVGRYTRSVRQSHRAGVEPVLAAGDREWEEEDRRKSEGIRLDPETISALNRFAVERSIPPLQTVTKIKAETRWKKNLRGGKYDQSEIQAH
ncbi:Ldh family oxidoreductase [Roseinatronobacter alkalisoli]|uniref:Ldh family oxidoreductase n=1 Tax=Roseinatronobacter alkalisoli TaxID=3028235 RepID=A0ABT5TGE3_9RHOB|nr:Ldh family oxidoreductase [Roseinatronobacter sp. HJB301]MDD7973760.1 Ldh family oxidoreductase [Roseinatronobacter sp. HJB301]